MDIWRLYTNDVELGVTETGGQLDHVTFHTPAGPVRPMHAAPWSHEPLPADVPPMLRVLRGDFFCAPFGDSDVLADEQRPHGATANARWEVVRHEHTALDCQLEKAVCGAMVHKRITLVPGQPLVYEEHEFAGGDGTLPIGHHAMLRARHPLLLGFARWTHAATPPETFEGDPQRGLSRLAYPQVIANLGAVQEETGATVDVRQYPWSAGHEDLLLLAADPAQPFAWTAATCPAEGWVWFALKSPRQLRSTILWMSNGGRYYVPFERRHTEVLGLEEVTAFFHLGHARSAAANDLNAADVPTVVRLTPAKPLQIYYAFGLIPTNGSFGRVASLTHADGRLTLLDEDGRTVSCSVDPAFMARLTAAPQA